jgi:hypothetical protein
MLSIYLHILPCFVFILIVYYFSMQVIDQYEQAIAVLPAYYDAATEDNRK